MFVKNTGQNVVWSLMIATQPAHAPLPNIVNQIVTDAKLITSAGGITPEHGIM